MHRAAAGTGTRRPGRRRCRSTSPAGPAAIRARCGALVPRLEQHAADALVDGGHAGDLEHLLVFRQLPGRSRTSASRRHSSAAPSRSARPTIWPTHDALVFLRAPARTAPSRPVRWWPAAAARPSRSTTDVGRQRAVQRALVAVVHAVELAVDELHEAAALLLAAEEREPIIGDSVSATIADTVTAPASVNANSVNSAPVRPPGNRSARTPRSARRSSPGSGRPARARRAARPAAASCPLPSCAGRRSRPR